MTSSKAPVGILANPAAGRDIRRLVAQASVFPLSEKCNMIMRILTGLGTTGVGEVCMMPDAGGIAVRLRRVLEVPGHSQSGWPHVVFLDMAIEDGPRATLIAAKKMVEAGVGAIIVLGGDGTHRLVARVSGEVPITALSTGTNNVFPTLREATTAGIATGLVVSGRVPTDDLTIPNKVLRVRVDETEDLALVDICVSRALWTGSRAVWQVDGLDQLFVTFAEPDAIGLSTVAGLLRPVSRLDSHGLRIDLTSTQEASMIVRAPIAPGLIVPVGVGKVHEIFPGDTQTVRARQGVIALDGEREIEFGDSNGVTIWLDRNGPKTIQVERVMEFAAQEGLLVANQD